MSRRLRSWVALFAVFGVLFAQLAVAAYACEMLAPAAAAQVQQSGDEQPQHDCCGKAMENGASPLCHAHCKQDKQSLDKPSVQLPAAAAWVWAPLIPGSLLVADSSALPQQLPSLLVRDTAPPLAVRNCCFRI